MSVDRNGVGMKYRLPENRPMRHAVDLKGEQFGRLTVLARSGSDKWGRARWLCKCQCGIEKSIDSAALRSGRTKSCGCLSTELVRERQFEDLTGMSFGYTKVVKLFRQEYDSLWDCVCYCGKRFRARGKYLRAKSTFPSCGCHTEKSRVQNRANAIQHGHALRKQQTSEYSAYLNVKRRLKVSDAPSFSKFLILFGRRPSDRHRLFVIDGSKGLTQGNLEWRECKKSDKPRKPRQKKPPAPKPAALPTLPWAKPKQAA